ncbi:MAG TPA: beta-ketoacyl-[acyl-carrier-protein] synthase family protein [Saprospiraceae bacterium]|jgi:3-oxoacyl-(acyl-carrier-protein) synthase|nr:beta-ketoacyl-[acyl-carrier-protein] synthase family protein [Saprospiraceae bacterium]HRG43204.1 beta-ketoacyl-[acyl-carrier-protein] synthase family protein [Saprospiraceae bacterium]
MYVENKEIWITGMGIVSALGTDPNACFTQLHSAISPLRPLLLHESIHSEHYIGGAVPLSDTEIRQSTNTHHHAYNRTTLLALIASQQALDSAGIEDSTRDIISVNATTVGGMPLTEKYFDAIITGKYQVNTDFINEMDCGSLSRVIRRQHNLNRMHFMISTACSSGSNAIMFGARLIQAGKSSIVLAGGSDSISKFVLNGFLSLKNVDKNMCRPFDRDRFGLNLGEGSAYLVLEEKTHAQKRYKTPLAILSGYGNINENFHITGSSPDGQGAMNAMNLAIQKAALCPEQIDFIHTHGTSTLDNDLAESIAIKSIFGSSIRFGSSKSYTGHTLAASGCISSVLTIGMMQKGFIFPTLGFLNPIEETGMKPVSKVQENVHLKHCLVNSFGFGGNNTSLIFSKPD